MLKQLLIGGASLALLAGCGPNEELEGGDADAAWSVTKPMLLSATQDSGSPNALLGTEFDFPCEEGGTASFSSDLGRTSASVSAGGAATSVNWRVKFKGCQVDGIKIKGPLDFYVESVANSDGAFVEWNYGGDLTYTGEVRGSCLIEMTGKAGATASAASFEYSGSVCGNDASLTLNATADGATISNNVNGEEI